jgi:small conductance mechanosensitive channel
LDLQSLLNNYVIPIGGKLLGVVILWIVGGWVINLIGAIVGRALSARKVETTIATYLQSGLAFLLRLLLVIAILSVLGIETTSFAALLAAAGIAIGAAWGGLLAHFAAGVFLVFLRPYKVGDMITAGGVTGVVREIGLFVTSLDTGDNIRIYVGNSKLFSDNIINYSTNPYRRVDLSAQIAHSVDAYQAIQLLQERIIKIPNVLQTPAPGVEILEFNDRGTVIAVRPFCHNNDYWQVYFDTNKAIHDVVAEGKFAVPEQHVAIRSLA